MKPVNDFNWSYSRKVIHNFNLCGLFLPLKYSKASAEAAQAEIMVVNNDDIVEPINEPAIGENQREKPIPSSVAVDSNSAIAFDELGEWTDAKPDRKKGNKKKSRKD